MHIMEPADLFIKYLDPKFRDRVITRVGRDGRPKRGVRTVDGMPASSDLEFQQYRKPLRVPPKLDKYSPASRQSLSGSRIAASGRLGFAMERDYDAEAQVMAMEMEGGDIAVVFPTDGLGLLARDGMDPAVAATLA